MMVRIQIQLTKKQARRLKQLAAARGRSMADLIRASVDALLANPDAPDEESRRQRAVNAIGRFRSGAKDLAAEHDRHFVESVRR